MSPDVMTPPPDGEQVGKGHRHWVSAGVWAGLVAVCSAFLTLPAAAHGGEDHRHDDEPAAVPTATESVSSSASSSASSDLVELVLKLDRAETGQVRQARLFLSDYASNAPITGATLTVDWGEGLTSTAQTTAQAGIYTAEVQFPTAGTYSPLVTLTAGELSDLLTLEPIPVTDPPAAPFPMRDAAIVLGVALGVGVIGWRWLRRRPQPVIKPAPEVQP